MGKFGDAFGAVPYYAMVDGFRVCVFEEDLEAAREVLASADFAADGDQLAD